MFKLILEQQQRLKFTYQLVQYSFLVETNSFTLTLLLPCGNKHFHTNATASKSNQEGFQIKPGRGFQSHLCFQCSASTQIQGPRSFNVHILERHQGTPAELSNCIHTAVQEAPWEPFVHHSSLTGSCDQQAASLPELYVKGKNTYAHFPSLFLM